MHAVAVLLVAEHMNDLLREAAAERRRSLVRSSRRPGRSAFFGGLAGLLRRLTGGSRGRSTAGRSTDPRPATA